MKRITSALLLTASLFAGLAFAADLAQVKRDGLVGERADGYLGLVQENAPRDVAELVRTINAKRLAEYQRIAGENQLSVEQVQALAGKKAIERTDPGGWVLLNGGWQKK